MQSSTGAMRARPLACQIFWATHGKRRLGYYSRCVLVEVRESVVEAMDVEVKYGFERLKVKVIDV